MWGTWRGKAMAGPTTAGALLEPRARARYPGRFGAGSGATSHRHLQLRQGGAAADLLPPVRVRGRRPAGGRGADRAAGGRGRDPRSPRRHRGPHPPGWRGRRSGALRRRSPRGELRHLARARRLRAGARARRARAPGSSHPLHLPRHAAREHRARRRPRLAHPGSLRREGQAPPSRAPPGRAPGEHRADEPARAHPGRDRAERALRAPSGGRPPGEGAARRRVEPRRRHRGGRVRPPPVPDRRAVAPRAGRARRREAAAPVRSTGAAPAGRPRADGARGGAARVRCEQSRSVLQDGPGTEKRSVLAVTGWAPALLLLLALPLAASGGSPPLALTVTPSRIEFTRDDAPSALKLTLELAASAV